MCHGDECWLYCPPQWALNDVMMTRSVNLPRLLQRQSGVCVRGFLCVCFPLWHAEGSAAVINDSLLNGAMWSYMVMRRQRCGARRDNQLSRERERESMVDAQVTHCVTQAWTGLFGHQKDLLWDCSSWFYTVQKSWDDLKFQGNLSPTLTFKGTAHPKIILNIFVPLVCSAVHPSRLFWCELQRFGDIRRRGVCLFSSIMGLDGTQLVVTQDNPQTFLWAVSRRNLFLSSRKKIVLVDSTAERTRVHETVHNEVCRLSQVMGSWLLQRDSAVEFFKCISWHWDHD